MTKNSSSAPRAIPNAGPDFERLLGQEVVIEASQGPARTGAQSIEPDHSPRALQSGTSAQVRPLPGMGILPDTGAGTDVQREVEQFLYLQAELLDSKHWQAWIDLFDAQGVYWMPVMVCPGSAGLPALDQRRSRPPWCRNQFPRPARNRPVSEE